MAKNTTHDPVTPLPLPGGRCPVCNKPAMAPHRPFCSVRCANIDLGRWLKGNYAVETEESPEEGEMPGRDEQ